MRQNVEMIVITVRLLTYSQIFEIIRQNFEKQKSNFQDKMSEL